MLRVVYLPAMVLCILFTERAHAQEATPAVAVRTFSLRNIRPEDAAQLVAPYVLSPKAGVFRAGGSLPAITVRETAQNLARIDSLLRVYDRPPEAMVIRFQLLASDSVSGDASLDAADSALRRLLSSGRYRLVSEGVARVSEREPFALTLAAGAERFALSGSVSSISADGRTGSARIQVTLARGDAALHEGRRIPGEVLLSTGVTLSLGRPVAVGSAAPGGKVQALVLVIGSEVVASESR